MNWDDYLPFLTSYVTNGSLALGLRDIDGNCIIVSKNLVGAPLHEGHIYLDENNFPGIGNYLFRMDWAKPTGHYYHSGYCDYPEYKINAALLKKPFDLESD